MTTHHQTLALAILIPFGLSLAGCGGSNSADPTETKKPKTEAKPEAKAETTDEAKPADPTAADGYQGYLLAALGEVTATAAVTKAETKAYGCSVKYSGEGSAVEARIGEPAPAFTLPDLDGKEVSLADFAGKTVVLEWFNPDCPFVKYAHGEGGPLATLGNEQTRAGVVWLAINSGAEGKEGAGVERNKAAKSEWKLEHPILIDTTGEVGHRYGAKTTPHMFVIGPDGKLVYAGGVDNAPLGKVES